MSGMTVYFIRRLMLVPVTFLIITLMVYSILRYVPGGPIEQAEAAMKMAAMSGEGGGGNSESTTLQLDEEAMEELKRYYALDKPVLTGYLQWLGIYPREFRRRVPVVPEKGNEKNARELREAHKKLSVAKEALEKHLSPKHFVHLEGRLYQPESIEGLDKTTQDALNSEKAQSFGKHQNLNNLLKPHNLIFLDGKFLSPIDTKDPQLQAFLQQAAPLLKAVKKAQESMHHKETTSGLKLTTSGHLIRTAFDRLIELNTRKVEVGKALQAQLTPKKISIFDQQFYEPISEEALKKVDKAILETAGSLVSQGFGKRDELLSFLRNHNMTWKKNEYYRLVTQESRDKDKDFFTSVQTLLKALTMANARLLRVEHFQGFRINEEGVIYQIENARAGILQGDFGRSYTRSEPVLKSIVSKFEVSLQFGLIGYLLSWLICVPLGVFKALRHKTTFDSTTSAFVFLGYAIPGFVVCLMLLTWVAVNVEWLPLGGYKPDNIEELSNLDAFIGRVRHMLIPVIGYTIGGFATMTILMKNSLLENLGQDYIRTAFAKGLKEKRVIFVHALRNSLIPITAGIGHALGLLFAGSFLIEKTCNIDGMGLLGYQAIVERDYPIIMGVLVFGVLIRLFGNIISDVVWALIDPRIRFGS
ncbi:MAG: ABC transporter permease subunit [Myxococcota bacterium]|nr:ABC transporter permease subunit [Myxococcota bacterium]